MLEKKIFFFNLETNFKECAHDKKLSIYCDFEPPTHYVGGDIGENGIRTLSFISPQTQCVGGLKLQLGTIFMLNHAAMNFF